MKARTESVKKPGANGSARHARSKTDLSAAPSAPECPREQMIAEAAYYRAEQRGFVPGNEMSDWLLAEADVEHSLRKLH